MSKRVLITGGAGFVGSHLVDALLARRSCGREYSTTCLRRCIRSGMPDYLATDIEFVQGDMRDLDAVRAAHWPAST